ncbi:MAG: sterol desaturase family protein [Myxococcota bacterium]
MAFAEDLLDYATPVAFLAFVVGATGLAFSLELPIFLVTSVAVAPTALAAAVLERLRPERLAYRPLDQPFRVELAHFLINYHLGYAIALAGCAGLEYLLNASNAPRLWPSTWPLALQIVFAGVLGEGVSYWQHRLSHRNAWLWRFHALHHQGERLNLMRAGRFHFVDIGPGSLLVFAPLVLLRAPEHVLIWIASLSGAFGILEHANMRMRTPRWLSWLVCTPAVHRAHHSSEPVESDANFGTFTMLFDVLFGTFRPPRADGPAAVGIENYTPPAGFWAQLIAPFRRAA